MILIDISQIAISNIMMTPNIKTNDIDVNLVKHMILTSIKNYNQQFKSEFGDIVICCDSRYSWRKSVFLHYKANRKKEKDKSFIDWDVVNEAINGMKKDLKNFFPYKVVEFDGAEADDVIAVLSKYVKEQSVIISSDKDYGQLQKFTHVKQFCPKAKDYIHISNPHTQLKELIIRGDRSDGIPNFLSDADTFVNQSKRQKKIMTDKIPQYLSDDYSDDENYNRNKQLIDFEEIPKDIVLGVVRQYKSEPLGGKKTMMDFFINNNMKILLKDIGQF
jgi:hypothetical protein